jgi:hypothetical protein
VSRARTTKKLAQRIDLNYFKRPTPLKRAKFWLSVGLPALALVWIAWQGIAHDSSVYSSGRMSEAHAVLEAHCEACHVQAAGKFSAEATDAACLSCHDGPIHHATQAQTPHCTTCHAEHRGRVNIVAASSANCAQCHRDLKMRGNAASTYATHIESFENGHPEFATLRANGSAAASDPGTIRVNHAIHMKPIRRGPNGPNVQLECRDCHRTEADSTSPLVVWKFGDAQYTGAAVSYSTADELQPFAKGTLASYRPATGRELMAPVKFATACAGCHSLAFDKRFSEGVPHDRPEIVHAFLVKKFSDYIATHSGELREVREPGRGLTGKRVQPEVRVYATPKEWVAAKVGDAEELLWRKTCKQCHDIGFEDNTRIPQSGLEVMSAAVRNLPTVAHAHTTLIWMPHAKFDHDVHRGFSCVSCHEKAMSSTEASDILLPGIATCKTCHAPGPEHAEARCSECHTYHDWSQRREVEPTFALPARPAGDKKVTSCEKEGKRQISKQRTIKRKSAMEKIWALVKPRQSKENQI